MNFNSARKYCIFFPILIQKLLGKTSDVPFGGLSMMCVGDFYQLPPIRAPSVYREFRDPLLNVDHLWHMFEMAELTEVMRQRGDNDFVDLLNQVRVANVNADQVDILLSRVIAAGMEPADALHIYAENAPAIEHNKAMLDKLDGQLYSVDALDQIPRNVPISIVTQTLNQSQSETAGLAEIFEFKLNSKVMLTSNLDISDNLGNGQLGTIRQVLSDTRNNVVVIYVQFDDDKAGRKRMTSDPVAVSNHWVPIQKIEGDIKLKSRSCSTLVIKRVQFPLRLAWACTVHKVQGLSVPQVVVSFDLLKQTAFHYGQIYVALSRVTTLAGLYIIGNFNKSAIRADPRATSEYNRLRNHPMQTIHKFHSKTSNTYLSLLNVRSLKKHAEDVARTSMIYSDILCFTETQLRIGEEAIQVDSIFPNHNLVRNDNADKFQSIGFAYRKDMDVTDIKYSGRSVIQVKNTNVGSFTVILLYRKNQMQLHDFNQQLIHHMQTLTIDIILGDFNINSLASHSDMLSSTLSDYTPIVTDPTCITGSLLDNIYVRTALLNTWNVACSVDSIFFSDHEIIHFEISQI